MFSKTIPLSFYSHELRSRAVPFRTLLLQFLVTLPFVAILTLNFVLTAVPDFQPVGIEIRIDSVFPADPLKDRDNSVTGTRGDTQYRFKCHPVAALRVGERAALLVDATGTRTSVPACAAQEQEAASRARWSAWVFFSVLLFWVLCRFPAHR